MQKRHSPTLFLISETVNHSIQLEGEQLHRHTNEGKCQPVVMFKLCPAQFYALCKGFSPLKLQFEPSLQVRTMQVADWRQLANATQVPEVKVTAKAYLASTSVIGFTLGQGLSFITFVNTVPISANRTINRFALIRRLDVDRVGSFVFNMPAWDAAARSAMIK